jgi:hypothetical protein
MDVDLILLVGGSGDGVSSHGHLDNASAIEGHLSRGVHRLGAPRTSVVALPGCAPPPDTAPAATTSGSGSGSTSTSTANSGLDASLAGWLVATEPAFDAVVASLVQRHADRVASLGTTTPPTHPHPHEQLEGH